MKISIFGFTAQMGCFHPSADWQHVTMSLRWLNCKWLWRFSLGKKNCVRPQMFPYTTCSGTENASKMFQLPGGKSNVFVVCLWLVKIELSHAFDTKKNQFKIQLYCKWQSWKDFFEFFCSTAFQYHLQSTAKFRLDAKHKRWMRKNTMNGSNSSFDYYIHIRSHSECVDTNNNSNDQPTKTAVTLALHRIGRPRVFCWNGEKITIIPPLIQN